MPSPRPTCFAILQLLLLVASSILWLPLVQAQAQDSADSPASLLAGYSFRSSYKRSRLPKYLREISGLAVDSNQRLILHDDNNARIWSFDTQALRLSANPLQDQPIKGDFEGIARFNDSVVLSASIGSIRLLNPAIETTSGSMSQWVVQNGWIDLPFKGRCNFEGLGILNEQGPGATLLMPCKYPWFEQAGDEPADDHLLYVFRHQLNSDASPGEKSLEPITVNVTPVLKAFRLPRLRPSAIEVVGTRLLILAGKERVLLETDLTGKLIDWQRLRWPRHRQAEGLTVMPDGTLVIADEGRWLGGTLTQYRSKTR